MTETTTRGDWHTDTRNISTAYVSRSLDKAACDCENPDDCSGECDAAILGAAYDLRSMFAAGVVIREVREVTPYGLPFPRLDASVNGTIGASTSGYWDLAEGLACLLGEMAEG